VPGATLFRVEAPGVYTAEGVAGRSRVIANLLEPAITDVNATRLEPAPPAELSMSRAVSRPEPWVALLLAALALMLVEWWTYHRRWTV
jgi:hypothetical protein